MNAYVECIPPEKIVGRELTDVDGYFRISPLDTGCVDIVFKFQGLTLTKEGAMRSRGSVADVSGTMRTLGIPGCPIGRRSCSVPYVDPAHPGGRITHSGNMRW